jgi:hypothetical protein
MAVTQKTDPWRSLPDIDQLTRGTHKMWDPPLAHWKSVNDRIGHVRGSLSINPRVARKPCCDNTKVDPDNAMPTRVGMVSWLDIEITMTVTGSYDNKDIKYRTDSTVRRIQKKKTIEVSERRTTNMIKLVTWCYDSKWYKGRYTKHQGVSRTKVCCDPISTTYKGTNMLGYIKSPPSIQLHQTVYNVPMLSYSTQF